MPVNDNVQLNPGVGGATVATLSDGTLEWPLGVPAYRTGGVANAWTFQVIDSTHGQPTLLMDGAGNQIGVKPLNVQVVGTDYGLITNSVIHGLTTAGGGSYVDVKVNPSGALAVDASGTTVTITGSVSLTGTSPVNVSQLNGVTITTGSGVVGTGVQRVTLATDVPLPAGTNVLGGVNQNGVWTVQPGNSANTTAWRIRKNDGTNDAAAFFDLDTGAGTQYIEGINLRISGTGGSIEAKGQQAMASSIPVVIASDQGALSVNASQTGTWNIGSVSSVTTVTGITNVVHVDDNSASLTVDNTGTFAVQAAPVTGAIFNGATSLTPKFAKISAAASGDNTLVAGVSTKKIRVLAIGLVATGSAALDIYFRDNTAGTAIWADGTNPIPLDPTGALGAGGFILGYNPLGWMETSASNPLVINLSAAQGVAGGLTYCEV